jgi:rubrerythrin
MHRNVVNVMNQLIRLDLTAIRAYEQAIEGAKSVEIRERLTAFMADHHRHVRDLRALVVAYGGKPARRRGLMGALIEGFTAALAMGNRTALFAMRGNEELTNRTYAAALMRPLPENARALIALNYADEMRHLAWIMEARKVRAWPF